MSPSEFLWAQSSREHRRRDDPSGGENRDHPSRPGGSTWGPHPELKGAKFSPVSSLHRGAQSTAWSYGRWSNGESSLEGRSLAASPRLLFQLLTVHCWASLMAQMVKNRPAVWETWVRSLGQEDPLEKRMALHSSILAWRIPWTEESDGLVHGVTKSQTQPSDHHSFRTFLPASIWPSTASSSVCLPKSSYLHLYFISIAVCPSSIPSTLDTHL